MGEYSAFIAPERRSVATPRDLVSDGKCRFGTFDGEFETMDLLGIRNPTAAPDLFKRLKLTLWQATEIHLEQGMLLAVCCDMAVFGLVLHVYYDKRSRKVYSWSSRLPSSRTQIAPNLLRGAESHAEGEGFGIRYVNDLQDGRCRLEGRHEGPDGTLEYSFALSRLSLPGVVSIPFADPAKRHRPLYSQKDFLKAEGSLRFNGESFSTTETSCAVLDDHRGYYPRRAHYDWVTTMGVRETDGERRWFAFNLTRNQSVDQERYNENLIWLEGETSLLPPVQFFRDVPTAEFRDRALWQVRDAHDMVRLDLTVYDVFRMVTHAWPFVQIDYFVAFGELSGYLRDENGQKYILDGMPGMGEDKTLLF